VIRGIGSSSLLFFLISFTVPALGQPPTDAQLSAIRSACRGDYKSVCADVPTGGKESLQCLQQHADAVSSPCRDALAAVNAKASPPPAATAAPAQAQAPPASAAPQMSRREQAHLLRTDCGGDFQKFCSSVQLGGGRGLACLQAHAAELTSLCQSALLAAQKK
jgi:Cysteine rich repeat